MNTIDIIRSSAFTIDDFEQATKKLRDAMNIPNNITPAGALHPILVSTPLINPIRRGDKTMTRRIVKEGVPIGNWEETLKHCPYQVGDILWVRETYFDCSKVKDAPLFANINGNFVYRADTDFIGCHKWKPCIFMPKKACRVFIEVTDIKIERLCDITREDIELEGVEKRFNTTTNSWMYLDYSTLLGWTDIGPSFKSLWERINGSGSWNLNPWVWVYTFIVVERPANFIQEQHDHF